MSYDKSIALLLYKLKGNTFNRTLHSAVSKINYSVHTQIIIDTMLFEL